MIKYDVKVIIVKCFSELFTRAENSSLHINASQWRDLKRVNKVSNTPSLYFVFVQLFIQNENYRF